MDSDDSQQDLFANTQIETKNPHVNDSNPNEWNDTDFEYPMLVLFLWNGQIKPFTLVSLIELNPRDVDGKWLSGVLSPTSRLKHRNFRLYPDFGVSVFGKIQKSISHKEIKNI